MGNAVKKKRNRLFRTSVTKQEVLERIKVVNGCWEWNAVMNRVQMMSFVEKR